MTAMVSRCGGAVHLDTAGSTFGCNWSDVSCLKCMDSKTILASKPGDKALGEMQLRSQQFGVVGRQHLKAGCVRTRRVAAFASPRSNDQPQVADSETSRRQVLQQGLIAAVASAIGFRPEAADAASLPPQNIKGLCEADCLSELESKELVSLPSGLQYRDIVVGKGPNPPVGFQAVVNYVAMTPDGRIFDSSVEKGKPYDIRVGAGQVIAGLDEGLKTMRPGGLRRLYIPGSMSFPKGLKAAPGRPSVPPSSPVMFDVQLLYVPGLDDDE